MRSYLQLLQTILLAVSVCLLFSLNVSAQAGNGQYAHVVEEGAEYIEKNINLNNLFRNIGNRGSTSAVSGSAVGLSTSSRQIGSAGNTGSEILLGIQQLSGIRAIADLNEVLSQFGSATGDSWTGIAFQKGRNYSWQELPLAIALASAFSGILKADELETLGQANTNFGGILANVGIGGGSGGGGLGGAVSGGLGGAISGGLGGLGGDIFGGIGTIINGIQNGDWLGAIVTGIGQILGNSDLMQIGGIASILGNGGSVGDALGSVGGIGAFGSGFGGGNLGGVISSVTGSGGSCPGGNCSIGGSNSQPAYSYPQPTYSSPVGTTSPNGGQQGLGLPEWNSGDGPDNVVLGGGLFPDNPS